MNFCADELAIIDLMNSHNCLCWSSMILWLSDWITLSHFYKMSAISKVVLPSNNVLENCLTLSCHSFLLNSVSVSCIALLNES